MVVGIQLENTVHAGNKAKKLQTFTSRARIVFRVTRRTAGAHGGSVRSAIGTGLGNAVGTRARVH